MAQIASGAFQRLGQALAPGMTERDAARHLTIDMLANGADATRYLQELTPQRITLHVTQITVILTLSNQVEIQCVASYAHNLIPNEISAHLDQ